MNDSPMTPERFAALAEAYGAQIRRWPECDRGAAAAFSNTELGKDILRRADALDALLDTYAPPQVPAALRADLVRSASRHVTKQRRLRWGFSLAGVGIAGLLVGLIVTKLITPSDYTPFHPPELGTGMTAFGDITTDFGISERED